jgi:hypothetical protein
VSIDRAPQPFEDFTMVSNDFLQDGRLSYLARGLLTAIVSRPDERASAASLVAGGKESLEEVQAALDELVAAGYLNCDVECADVTP